MRGTTDKVTGRIKQAIGALTGNEKLKRHGRADERAGRIKRRSDATIDVVLDKLGDAAETLHASDKEK
jgi:uncharacterized protein YjbJ (UPF0337 family)